MKDARPVLRGAQWQSVATTPTRHRRPNGVAKQTTTPTGPRALRLLAHGPEGHRFAVALRVTRALSSFPLRPAPWHHQRRARGRRTFTTFEGLSSAFVDVAFAYDPCAFVSACSWLLESIVQQWAGPRLQHD